MLINELLNTVWPYEWQNDSVAAFTTPQGHQGAVVFELYEAELAGAHVEFSIDDRYDITGRGNELAVFSTVLKIIREYEVRHDLHVLFMESSEANRTRLYQRMAHRLGYHQVPRAAYQQLLQRLALDGQQGVVADPQGIHPWALIFVHAESLPQLQELGL